MIGNRSGRRRIASRAVAVLSAMSAIGLAGTLLSGVMPSASAFDCNGAKRRPYIKVENRDKYVANFEVWAYRRVPCRS